MATKFISRKNRQGSRWYLEENVTWTRSAKSQKFQTQNSQPKMLQIVVPMLTNYCLNAMLRHLPPLLHFTRIYHLCHYWILGWKNCALQDLCYHVNCSLRSNRWVRKWEKKNISNKSVPPSYSYVWAWLMLHNIHVITGGLYEKDQFTTTSTTYLLWKKQML